MFEEMIAKAISTSLADTIGLDLPFGSVMVHFSPTGEKCHGYKIFVSDDEIFLGRTGGGCAWMLESGVGVVLLHTQNLGNRSLLLHEVGHFKTHREGLGPVEKERLADQWAVENGGSLEELRKCTDAAILQIAKMVLKKKPLRFCLIGPIAAPVVWVFQYLRFR